ncbi:hypothetical protein HDU96_005149 [Phlyctochytrium bullatum]|nr:hypothetical protein HDU96_005149 [Phlyctochytrium bullatum]
MFPSCIQRGCLRLLHSLDYHQPIAPVAASGLLTRLAGRRARTLLVTVRCLLALAVPAIWVARLCLLHWETTHLAAPATDTIVWNTTHSESSAAVPFPQAIKGQTVLAARGEPADPAAPPAHHPDAAAAVLDPHLPTWYERFFAGGVAVQSDAGADRQTSQTSRWKTLMAIVKFRLLPTSGWEEGWEGPHTMSVSFVLSLFCYLILLILHDSQQIRDLTHMRSLSPLTHLTLLLLHLLTLSVLLAAFFTECLLRFLHLPTLPTSTLPADAWLCLLAVCSELLLSRFSAPGALARLVLPLWAVLSVAFGTACTLEAWRWRVARSTDPPPPTLPTLSLLEAAEPHTPTAALRRLGFTFLGLVLILSSLTLIVIVEAVRDVAFPVPPVEDLRDWDDGEVAVWDGETGTVVVEEAGKGVGDAVVEARWFAEVGEDVDVMERVGAGGKEGVALLVEKC